MRFDLKAGSLRTRLGRDAWRANGIAGGKLGGEEGGDGCCGRGGRAELQLLGIGTGEGERVTRRMGWLRRAAPARWSEATAGIAAREYGRCSSLVFRAWSPAMRESLPLSE